MSILEVIKDIINVSAIPVYAIEFPLDADGLLIEESNITSLEDIDGLTGTVSSTIQLFVQYPKKAGTYKMLTELINESYEKVYNAQNTVVSGIYIERVGMKNMTSFTIKEGKKYIVSMIFTIRYKFN